MRWFLLCVALLASASSAFAGEITASRNLRVGTILTASDLILADGTAETSIERLVGLEVRKTIYAGRAIAIDNLGPQTMVRRNDIVTMSYAIGGLALRTEGRSLGAGGIGERIEVMNLDTRLTVRATIVGSRRVRVGQ
ncbi:MAG: flagellar basal body P-ring formation chaperone FlgA [Pseudomonadota bacterium]